jgi:hypothetical protein
MFTFATLIFASAGGDILWLLLLIICACGAYSEIKKWHDEQALRKQDPATYLALQKLELEKEKMEHERKQSVLNIGGAIGSTLLNRFLK